MLESPLSSRRALLTALAAVPLGWRPRAAGAAGWSAAGAPASPPAPSAAPAVPPVAPAVEVHAEFPRQDLRLVRETVGASHRDLGRVRELVEANPALARAAWDWGFGDWETALGAAAHTGRREIAEFLLAHGAPPTIFSAAMLGQLAVVRTLLEAAPAYRSIPGPHGIPLVEHARAGGDAARPVLEYLESLPALAETAPPAVALAADERARCLGTYRYGGAESEVLEVIEKSEGLRIQRPGDSELRLTHLGSGEFRPAGAPAVRLRFSPGGAAAPALEVRDGGLLLVARRVVAGGR